MATNRAPQINTAIKFLAGYMAGRKEYTEKKKRDEMSQRFMDMAKSENMASTIKWDPEKGMTVTLTSRKPGEATDKLPGMARTAFGLPGGPPLSLEDVSPYIPQMPNVASSHAGGGFVGVPEGDITMPTESEYGQITGPGGEQAGEFMPGAEPYPFPLTDEQKLSMGTSGLREHISGMGLTPNVPGFARTPAAKQPSDTAQYRQVLQEAIDTGDFSKLNTQYPDKVLAPATIRVLSYMQTNIKSGKVTVQDAIKKLSQAQEKNPENFKDVDVQYIINYFTRPPAIVRPTPVPTLQVTEPEPEYAALPWIE